MNGPRRVRRPGRLIGLGPVVLLAMASTGPVRAHEQAADIGGRWDVESATSIRRNTDGTVEVLATSQFRFDLSVEGDQVTAVWQRADGTGEPPMTLTGTWKDGRLDLASAWAESEATNRGERVTVTVRWVMRGSLTDGRLGGTRFVEIHGRERDAAPISWVGTRPG